MPRPGACGLRFKGAGARPRAWGLGPRVWQCRRLKPWGLVPGLRFAGGRPRAQGLRHGLRVRFAIVLVATA
eukprot:4612635-Pyramimonas_sp.AAC.1